MRRRIPFILIAMLTIAPGCDDAPEAVSVPEPEAPAAELAEPPAPKITLRDEMRNRAQQVFGVLPDAAPSESNEATEEKITLGRMLFFDPRLSKNHDISCNSCHGLATYGVDGEATSPGHQGQRGGRNSPTVYNAALHVAQFWDGRSPDVEDQAKGPVLNPIEMAMPSEAATVAVLKSVPGYAEYFAEAFPDDEDPITYDNMARAIGAFERGLITADRFDAFASGQDEALSDEELAGLSLFQSSAGGPPADLGDAPTDDPRLFDHAHIGMRVSHVGGDVRGYREHSGLYRQYRCPGSPDPRRRNHGCRRATL